MYREPKNSPYIPNEQKDIYREKMEQQGKTPDKSQPLLNLQLYQQEKPKEKMDINTLVSNAALASPYIPPYSNIGVQPYMLPQIGTNNINITKNYQINTIGPTDDHAKISYIYEDVMPAKTMNMTSKTLSERLTTYNYIRAILFSRGDGGCVNLDGKGSDSLLSHIKFMDLNPYNTYKFSNNPYMGLPNGFLLYRSCYPIRHDPLTSSVSCARGSMGSNVRIYKLTDEEYNVNNIPGANMMMYNVWRDMVYYGYVREQIVKRKECPNFIIMYGYYLNDKSNINFDSLTSIKRSAEKNMIRQSTNIATNTMVANSTSKTSPIMGSCDTNNLSQSSAQWNNTNIKNGQNNVGKSLISITESPMYNIFNWASKIYQAEGNVRRMIHTGFHSDNVWYSILFQIMSALYSLQIHGIIFRNYSVEDNIYIKDISLHSNVTNYWKYKIDGIDYYIPNHGYIALVDSSYKDIGLNNQRGDNHKMIGKIFEDSLPINDMMLKTFDQFRETFNSNIFSQSFIDFGGCKPSPEILRFLDKITNQASTDKKYDIGEYFHKNMRHYMNNRIGTYLKETEVSSIRKNDIKEFTRGTIVVHEESANTYRFVLFYEQKDGGLCRILTKDTNINEIIERDVQMSILYSYSKVEPIIQNFKINDSNMNEDELLETYIINKN